MHYPLTSDNKDFLGKYTEYLSSSYGRLAKLVSQFMAHNICEYFGGKTEFPLLHQISSRSKSATSILRNRRQTNKYNKFTCIKEIRDLAGSRLIFYFKDDLKTFVKDHQKDHQEDSFKDWFGDSFELKNIRGSTRDDGTRIVSLPGYQSYHLDITVTPNTLFYDSLRTNDREALEGLHCEVQLRTVFKHSWAQTEHALRYKRANVPEAEIEKLMYAAAAIDIGEEIVGDYKTLLTKRNKSNCTSRTANDSPDVLATSSAPAKVDRFSHGDVCYQYELLHDVSCLSQEGETAYPLVTVRPRIFDVDQVINNAYRVENYKALMWKELQKDEHKSLVAAVTYDSLVARVARFEPDNDSSKSTPTLHLQPALYSDSVVTNHRGSLMRAIVGSSSGKPVSDLAEDCTTQAYKSFSTSPLANVLGVSCVIRTEDPVWVVAERSRSVAFDPGQLGCPASGVMGWSDFGNWRKRSFKNWCLGSISRELEEEIGYAAEPDDFIYLGFAREVGRAGKPQLFCFLDLCKTPFKTIRSMWGTYTYPKMPDLITNGVSEYRDLRSLTPDEVRQLVGPRDGRAFKEVSRGVRVSEELRMNLVLARRFLREI